jgi:hypothetical protein
MLIDCRAGDQAKTCRFQAVPFVSEQTTPSSLSKRPEEEDVRYMLMIHQGSTPLPGSPEWEQLSQQQKGEVYSSYREVNETPGVSAGLQLERPENATTVRVSDGETLITDGPFVETKEAIGGYLHFEADDLDAAIALAARIPAARMGGAIEVRPIVER